MSETTYERLLKIATGWKFPEETGAMTTNRISARGDYDRYFFDLDLCARSKGWIQYDTFQDAWYFGVWVHPERREIVTYAEGDVILRRCHTAEAYHAELAEMAKFYGPPPPSAIVIQPGVGVTAYYDTRPE